MIHSETKSAATDVETSQISSKGAVNRSRPLRMQRPYQSGDRLLRSYAVRGSDIASLPGTAVIALHVELGGMGELLDMHQRQTCFSARYVRSLLHAELPGLEHLLRHSPFSTDEDAAVANAAC